VRDVAGKTQDVRSVQENPRSEDAVGGATDEARERRGRGGAGRATSRGARRGGVLLKQPLVGDGIAQGDGAVVGHQRIGGDVRGEQRHRSQPARIRQFGQCGRQREPARIPTEVSSAELTTAGIPACATMSSARRTPPSGATFTTRRSAAPARATLRGSDSLRTLSSAAISTGVPADCKAAAHLRQALDLRHGLLSVFKSDVGQPGECLHGRRDVPAAVGVHADGGVREGGADGGDAGGVVVERLAALGDLDLDGVHAAEPGKYFRHAVRRNGGHGGVDRDLVRRGSGKPSQPASMAAASQREASASPYSGKGQNSPQPAGRAAAATRVP
jgi:hypothetical protein